MPESIVYIHGVPHSGEMWRPFVERTGGLTPDLPGFGSTDKPADRDYSFRGQARFVSELTAGLDRFSLVVHDWGAVALVAAMERPEAIERLVLIDTVPFLPGYRWHTLARIWRTPVAGEMFMGLSSRWGFRQIGRMQGVNPADAQVLLDEFWPHFDHGTQRAILKLYRSAPEDLLPEIGRDLGKLTAPALIIWGDSDPYLPTRFAHDYAAALGGPAQVEIVEGGGHWPWMQRPDLVDRVASFVSG